MVSVEDNGMKKGLTVNADGEKLFKTTKKSYAIIDSGKHEIGIVANKKKVEGTASVKVEEVKLSKKIAKKYKLVSSAVKASDAQELCERFGGSLAEVKEKDIAKIVKAAKKLIEAGVTQVWIDRVIKEEDETFSYFPTALDLARSKDVVDPDNVYGGSETYASEQINAIKYDKDSQKKKYKKALAKAEAKIRKHMDKLLDGKDTTERRPVLCRFD